MTKFQTIDEDMEEFLHSRNVEKDCILHLRTEKIDSEIICLMDDEILSKFIPKYGDRLALKQFCNKKKNKCVETRKQSLIDKLKKKIKKKNQSLSSSDDEENIKKSKNASGNWKKTRQIELGWLCSTNGDKYIQIRTKKGGGTRKVSVPKDASKDYIIEKGLNLFFPNGVSSKGNINQFSIELWDFKSNAINDQLNIEEMFIFSGLARLRFYLATKEIVPIETSAIHENVEQDPEPESAIQQMTHFGDLPMPMVSTSSQSEENSSTYYNDELYHYINSSIAVNQFENSIPSLIGDGLSDNDGNVFQTDAKEIILHRGHVFEELLTEFICIDKYCGTLIIKMLLPNGEEETGLDFGGVFRDALSEFWGTFYSKCTVGTNAKVPYIRHDFNQQKWSSVAKIIYRGWMDVNYFPIELSKIFMEYCLSGEITSTILDSFYMFLSNNEAEVLKSAIEEYEEVDYDELIEVLGNLECKVLVNKDNVVKTIKDIAHKELIQKPMFVIDCWQLILKNMISDTELENIYKNYKVTSKNILGLLSYNNDILGSEEVKIIGFLKKFIREIEEMNLKKFLRFCTGADVITNNKITIIFNKNSGLYRVPVAHTCVCTLDLSTTYDNFPEFRSEFISILSSNIWVMDIV